MLRTRRNTLPHFTLEELARVQEKLLKFDALMKKHLQRHFKMKLNHSKYHMQVSSKKPLIHFIRSNALQVHCCGHQQIHTLLLPSDETCHKYPCTNFFL